MVDEEAQSNGYVVGPVYHGTKQRFVSFEHKRDPSKLFYFSFDKEFAGSYARGIGSHRTPPDDIKQRIDKAYKDSQAFADEIEGDYAEYDNASSWPIEKAEEYLERIREYEKTLLDGMTVSQAQTAMGIRVLSVYLKADRVFDPTKNWEEFKSVVIKTTGHKSESEVNNQMWYYIKSGNYLIWENKELVDAILQKYDAFMIAEHSSEPARTIAVRESSRIKLADPITYDDNENVIPLSNRFNSTVQDVRESTI